MDLVAHLSARNTAVAKLPYEAPSGAMLLLVITRILAAEAASYGGIAAFIGVSAVIVSIAAIVSTASIVPTAAIVSIIS